MPHYGLTRVITRDMKTANVRPLNHTDFDRLSSSFCNFWLLFFKSVWEKKPSPWQRGLIWDTHLQASSPGMPLCHQVSGAWTTWKKHVMSWHVTFVLKFEVIGVQTCQSLCNWLYFLLLLQMDEVIDDIISMQSNYDDIQGYIDPVQMPNTVSPSSNFNPEEKVERNLYVYLVQILNPSCCYLVFAGNKSNMQYSSETPAWSTAYLSKGNLVILVVEIVAELWDKLLGWTVGTK